MNTALQSSTNYHAGRVAEGSVAQSYSRRGLRLAAQRWRGRGGEIDLIFRDGDAVVFVEVKKSRTHDEAARRVRPRQIERIFNTASEFVAGEPNGQMTEMRFDVALVDSHGAIKVVENALMAA